MFSLRTFLLFFTCIHLLACSRDDTPVELDIVTASTPDQFLQYPNMQASLPAGEYTVVVASSLAGKQGDYHLEIIQAHSENTEHNGRWTASGGMNANSPDNPRHTFTLHRAGGVRIILRSSIDNYLYLLDRAGNILYEDDNSGSGNNAYLDIPESRINNATWTQAYYATIDPLNERDTLNKWKSRNGFDQGYDAHVIFRDTKDLGYGRSMFMRRNANGCLAIYVENFRVDLVKGLPYSTLNLTAAIENDRIHHFGSNAIEYSDLDGDCDGSDPMFNKFYTFRADPANPDADEPRIDRVDLDNRGEKFMPLPCITCHGGQARPLLSDGSFPSAALPGQLNPELRRGDTNAKLQPLEIDTFEFSDKPGYSRAEQEQKLKLINEAVFSTFPASRADGEWDADFIREVVDGWYAGHFISASNSNAFDGNFVPAGWRYDPSDTSIPVTRPSTSEQLFLKVIKPYCFACHSKRGTTMGSASNNSNFGGESSDVNFSSYEKFISHIDQIEDYVYARGLMPMSRLTYDKFWESDAPEILATHINGFRYSNTDGSISPPGKPIAYAGIDRTAVSPVTLTAEASAFTQTHSWHILSQPASANASLNTPQSLRAQLVTDTDGIYVIQLTGMNTQGQSHSDTVTITIDSSLAIAQHDLRFETHILPLLQGGTSTSCLDCHATTGIAGVPLYYDTDSSGYSIYENVIERVNYRYPQHSKLLRKPVGVHHYGGTPVTDPANYNTLINWVTEGAIIR